MQRSIDRVLTTHAGSLPRPEALREAWSQPGSDAQQEAKLEALLKKSVVDIVAEQKKAGVDIPNDGEFGKPMRAASDLAAWGTYIFGRLSGFGPTPAGAEAPDKARSGEPTHIVGRLEITEDTGGSEEYKRHVTAVHINRALAALNT